MMGRAFLVFACLLLAACAPLPPNPGLAQYQPGGGYRFPPLEQGREDDRLFVILAFSGGGTRAAALAYGVLEALKDTKLQWRGRKDMPLPEEVDVISSVSGGSFTAAYYALHGNGIFDEFPEKFL